MPGPRAATSASMTTVTGSLRNDSKNAAAWSNAADAAALASRLGPFFRTMSKDPTLLPPPGWGGAVRSIGCGGVISRRMTPPGTSGSAICPLAAGRESEAESAASVTPTVTVADNSRRSSRYSAAKS
jgi:hypothetical protein